MAIPVWITVDFFFRDWDENSSDSALWLCLQPHVERSQLESWIRASGSLNQMNHQLWTNSNRIDPETLVPVPFPGDTNLRVTATRGATVVLDRLNQRTTGPLLTDPVEFTRLNQVPQPANSPFSPTLAAGPFAKVFTDELLSAYRAIPAGDPSIDPVDAIADQLQLAFHGGTTRHFNAKCLDQLTAVDLLELDPSTEPVEAGVRISNQHSLLGLQVRLATRANAGVLATPGATSFIVQLSSPDGTSTSLDLIAGIPNPTELDNWLDWFAHPTDVSSAGEILPAVLQGFDQRVYVQDAPEAFAQLAPKSPFWRRRTQEPGKGRPLASTRRFATRPFKQTEPPPVQTLHVQPFAALDCELRPYRRSEIDRAPGPLQLRPKPLSRARFAAAFAKLATQPPGVIVLGDDAQPIRFVWLGSYELPWDAIDDPSTKVPTVLFWGVPSESDVTVLVPSSSAVMACEWRQDSDQLGRRWEPRTIPAGIDDLPFDALQLLDAVDDVVPGIIFPDSINFASARSVEAIEGVVRMTYPHSDPGSRGDPTDDYLGDLVNYNALNIRYTANKPCGGTLLNDHGYDFAVWHQSSGNAVEQTFHYRFGFKSDPDISQKTLPDVGKFFDDQFKAVGTPRALDFELTHTYGTRICLGNLDSAANPHARLPILPNEVATQSDAVAQSAFLAVEYSEDAATNTGLIALRFDEKVFNPPTPGNDDERRSQHMRIFSAFRSLAELGYADKVILKVRGCTFDYSKLTGKGLAAPLAYGLVDNVAASQWTYDLSQLKSQCRRRLTDNTVALDFEIRLSQAETQTFRDCNLLEFSIQVERFSSASPPTSATIKRLSTELGKDARQHTNFGYGRDGQNTSDGSPEEVAAYPSWREAMSTRKRPIIPRDQISKAIRDVFASGSDPRSVDSNSGTSWLAPPGLPVVSGDWPDLFAFSMGFLPLKRSKSLGSSTTAIARKFFDALAFIVDARPGVWNQNWALGDWQNHFRNLEKAAPKLVGMQEKALRLLQPVNDPRALDPNRIPDQIRDFLRDGSRWKAAIDQFVVESPGLFGSAKAIQITGIGKQRAATAIRPDLFRISQEHQIPVPPARGTTGPRSNNVVRSTDIRQGLPDPSGTGSFFGIDILDDVAYGNRYTLSNTAVQSFEALVDLAATARGVDAYVPQVSAVPTETVVALPSREPVTQPQHFFTGIVKDTTKVNWWDQKDAQGKVKPISAVDLISHQISFVPPADANALEFVAGGSNPRTSPAPSSRVDRSIICGVFSVNSDEEGSFENDTFSILYDPVQKAGAVPPEDNRPDGLFASLLSTPLLERNSSLSQVTNVSNIDTISDALEPVLPSPPVPADATSLFVLGQEIKFGATGANDGYCTSAALYRQTKASEAGTYRAFLIVTFEVPVWQVVKLGLYHSRDIVNAVAGVPPFAEGFGQTLGPAGNDVSYFNEQEVNRTGLAPTTLTGRMWTTDDLIKRLLVDQNLIDGAQWADKLAEVTIHHRQLVTLMSDDGAGADGSYSLDTNSRFALMRSELIPGQPKPASELFPLAYKDFSVDFIWHMNGNEFFRVMDVPVTIA
jgi:hypothetical protein